MVYEDHVRRAGNCPTFKATARASGTPIYMCCNNASPAADANVNSTSTYDSNTKAALSLSRLLKNPAQCFDRLSMSGSTPRFNCTSPFTLSLSKGAKTLFQQPASEVSGTTAADDVGLHNGAYQASPTPGVAGEVDRAVSLTGSRHVTMAYPNEFSPAAMTMSLWVKPNGTISTQQQIVAKFEGGSTCIKAPYAAAVAP